MESEQNCNILTSTLMAITAFFSRSPELLNRGHGDPASLGHVPHSSIFSPIGLISNCLTSCLHPGYTIVERPLSSNRTQSTPPRSRLYPDIPRPDAPVIYPGSLWKHAGSPRPKRQSKSTHKLLMVPFSDTLALSTCTEFPLDRQSTRNTILRF